METQVYGAGEYGFSTHVRAVNMLRKLITWQVGFKTVRLHIGFPRTFVLLLMVTARIHWEVWLLHSHIMPNISKERSVKFYASHEMQNGLFPISFIVTINMLYAVYGQCCPLEVSSTCSLQTSCLFWRRFSQDLFPCSVVIICLIGRFWQDSQNIPSL